jgi:hypothetical protein
MTFDLKKVIGNNVVAVLVIPNDAYSECLIEIARQVGSNYQKTCYVSLNKLYSALVTSFRNNKVNTNGFFFIDAITRSALPGVVDTESCKFVDSASDLQEIGVAINDEISKESYNTLIFDSLSTLQIYNKDDIVTEFTKFMIARLRLSNCVTFLACLEGDTNSKFIKNLCMFTDKMIHLEAHVIMEDDKTNVTIEARGSHI